MKHCETCTCIIQPTLTASELLTVAQAAKRLGLGTQAVRRLDDQLAPIRLGGGLRVYLTSVVEALRHERLSSRRSVRIL